jgi:hypothetical protein
LVDNPAIAAIIVHFRLRKFLYMFIFSYISSCQPPVKKAHAISLRIEHSR